MNQKKTFAKKVIDEINDGKESVLNLKKHVKSESSYCNVDFKQISDIFNRDFIPADLQSLLKKYMPYKCRWGVSDYMYPVGLNTTF